MKDWAKGLLATIIAGVAVYWLTVGLPKTDKPTLTSSPTTIPEQPKNDPVKPLGTATLVQQFSPSMTPLQFNTNYEGNDYQPAVEANSAQVCSDYCLRAAQCRAMTYVTDHRACWLKNAVSRGSYFEGAVSSVKQFK